MSKLNIVDLEGIKNGKLVRYKIPGVEFYYSEIQLVRLEREIRELRRIREAILNYFKNDTAKSLEQIPNIDDNRILLDDRNLFIGDYLNLTMPTKEGDIMCLFDNKSMVSSNAYDNLLDKKVDAILPYINNLFRLKENSNILDNAFYDASRIVDDSGDTMFEVNGDGVNLPLDSVEDLNLELLKYYYNNLDSILRNIIIPNPDLLSKYMSKTNMEKSVEIYKGVK